MAFSKKRTKIAAVAAVLIVLSLIAGSLIVLDQTKARNGPLENVTVSVPLLEQNALIYLAESQGLFAKNGLNLTIVHYDNGVAALNSMISGDANISVSAEFPFVRAAFEKQPLSIIASEDKFENEALIVRNDHGINNISDLNGKKIGVVKQTTAEFYLGRFLDLNGMSMQNVTVVGVTPAQSQEAIANGSIDALCIWQPYVDRIMKDVSNVEAWPVQASQACYSVLAARDDWLANHTSAVGKFLRSLSEAETYLVNNPEKAKSTIRDRLGYDEAYMAAIWPKNNFHLALDQTMVVAMQDEAHWMMNNNLTAENRIPDLTSMVYVDGLMGVRAESVNIVR